MSESAQGGGPSRHCRCSTSPRAPVTRRNCSRSPWVRAGGSSRRRQSRDRRTKRLADHPQANLIVVERPFEDPVPDQAPKLDLITLVLNYHDITYLPVDRAKMNARLFAALKPGGHFIVIDHSGRAGTSISEGKTLHRIEESVVLNEVSQAGFVLETEGSFLRNPADTRDEPSGEPKVPTDKFALRFVKQ